MVYDKLKPFKLDDEDSFPIGPAFWCIPVSEITEAEATKIHGFVGADLMGKEDVYVFQLPSEVLNVLQAIHSNTTGRVRAM